MLFIQMKLMMKMKKRLMRNFLKIFVSLILLVVFLFLFIIVMAYVDEYKYNHKYESPRKLSRLTGVKMPQYDVVELEKRGWLSHLKINDCLHAEFKSLPTEDFYNTLECLTKEEGSNWHMEDEMHFCYVDKENRAIVHITRESKLLQVYYGGGDLFWE